MNGVFILIKSLAVAVFIAYHKDYIAISVYHFLTYKLRGLLSFVNIKVLANDIRKY